MAEYKICPFCKQKILKNSIECLFCKRVLIEKLEHSTYQSQDDATQKEEKVSQQEIGQKKHNVIGYILEKLRGLKFFTIGLGIKMSLFFAKFNNWKVILIIVATTIFIIGIYKSENKKINPNFAVAKISPKIPENKPVPQYDNVRKDYFSLPNPNKSEQNKPQKHGITEKIFLDS